VATAQEHNSGVAAFSWHVGSTTIYHHANNDSNGKEEEDELPEELKRFGGELVEKIENEIMDSGDPVTLKTLPVCRCQPDGPSAGP
jgi:hypothetical protein